MSTISGGRRVHFHGNSKPYAKNPTLLSNCDAEVPLSSMNKVPEDISKIRKISHPMGFSRGSIEPNDSRLAKPFNLAPLGIAEDVVVRVDGFTFLADFVIQSENKQGKDFCSCIFIDFSKDDPFSGSTTTHSDDPSPSSSPVKTSDNFVKFADELAPLEFRYTVLLNKPLSDKDECFAPKDDNDEIDDFLAIEVSSNLEEGYFDSKGDIAFLIISTYRNMFADLVGRRADVASLTKWTEVWICQISQENSQKRTRERMSDQEAKEIKAEAREIHAQPSTVK
ncbi:hypothetical protein Tco_0313838 [Tanacetum coccineum]